jgi:colanic acid biosynthesis glycosyl transferase WcaI
VRAAEKLSPIRNLRLVIIGGGSKLDALAGETRARHLENVIFLPTQPGEVLPEMLASADVFVLTTRAGVGKTSFPARIYNYLLAARPVVASIDTDSDTAQMVREARVGLVTTPGDVEEFCAAITTLYHDGSARERMGLRGAEFMRRHYSANYVVEQYVGILKGLAVC